jgi:hypothetical protein
MNDVGYSEPEISLTKFNKFASDFAWACVLIAVVVSIFLAGMEEVRYRDALAKVVKRAGYGTTANKARFAEGVKFAERNGILPMKTPGLTWWLVAKVGLACGIQLVVLYWWIALMNLAIGASRNLRKIAEKEPSSTAQKQ